MITGLHGFLGRGSDWDFLRAAGLDVEGPDLFAASWTAVSMESWAEGFLAAIESEAKPVQPAPRQAFQSNTLLGYSLGGRLALHVLLADRGRHFDSAVIVSAGLGIEGAGERAGRPEADGRWAARFECDEWCRLISDWNAQPVFGGRPDERMPIESAFDRRALSHALRQWSPAVHAPLQDRLPEIAARVLWIAGEDDATYTAVGARAVALLENAEFWICPDAGHRVPWEQPERFAERIRTFLNEGTR